MTETELKKIISRGEALTVEFKSDREKLSERTGRGVDRIFEGVLRYGRTKPEYRIGEFDVSLHRHKLESFLRSEGTINRAKIMEFCQLTEKQTNLILRKMLESGGDRQDRVRTFNFIPISA